MKASMIWGSRIDADFGPTGCSVRIHGEKDLSRIGIFAVEVVSFNTFKSKTVRRYSIEAYQYGIDGEISEIHFQSFKTKAELKRAFKTFQLN